MRVDLAIDPQQVADDLAGFIRAQVDRAKAAGGVLGLSGGLDSTLVAYLAVRALGPDRVWPYLLPYRTSSPASTADGRLVAEQLGLSPTTIDVTAQIEAYFTALGDSTPLRLGNKVARERMSILYDQAKARGAIVLGTGNRTERLLGYCTLWGDMACDLAPLAGLFKSQVRQLAAFLGVPPSVIDKPPTADLWPGQTDEAELGIDYDTADALLHLIADRKLRNPQIAALGFAPEDIRRVRRLLRNTCHKRRLPPSPPPPPLAG